MTREKAKELLPVIQAFVNNKIVQYKEDNGHWEDSENLDFSDSSIRYRIKPTPTFRPWRPEEVPVGALIREKSWPSGKTAIIIEAGPNYFKYGMGMISDLHPLSLDMVQYSTDNGKTWLPCGVIEE